MSCSRRRCRLALGRRLCYGFRLLSLLSCSGLGLLRLGIARLSWLNSFAGSILHAIGFHLYAVLTLQIHCLAVNLKLHHTNIAVFYNQFILSLEGLLILSAHHTGKDFLAISLHL